MVVEVLLDDSTLAVVAFLPESVFPAQEIHSLLETNELLRLRKNFISPESGGAATRCELSLPLFGKLLEGWSIALPVDR